MSAHCSIISLFFFFNDTATTEIYTLSLHDALPISSIRATWRRKRTRCGAPKSLSKARRDVYRDSGKFRRRARPTQRSEEHTSELQSRQYLVCRLLLEKKKNKQYNYENVSI